MQAHLPCPDCGSSDGLADYGDHTYCFVCETYRHTHGERRHETMAKDLIPLSDMEYRPLRARGITQDTCRKYSYTCTTDDKGNALQVATYYDNEGNALFQKTRDKDKNFRVRGHQAYRFYGQHLYHSGRKLVITEGEIDCLTVSQVQDNKYPVVSIPFGATSAIAGRK